MDRKTKFDMLSVVAFGIHTEVRNRLQRAIEASSAHPRLHQVLRPIFFYEYFFDTPALRGEDASRSVAFAPFLKRLVGTRDFMAVPAGGFSQKEQGTAKTSSSLLSVHEGWKDVRMVPTTKENIARYWPEHVSFESAVRKSLILRLLHDAWNQVEAARLGSDEQIDIDKALDDFKGRLDVNESRPFVEVMPDTFAYQEGSVSLAAGFSRYFASQEYEAWGNTYAEESRDSWHREFLACIYPWLLSPPEIAADGRESDRLFEILACSISSRCLFFGELILFIPPIEDKVLRYRAYELLRTVLHQAVDDLYVPMLAMYENYDAESELENVLGPVITAQEGNPDEQQRAFPPAFSKERWDKAILFLKGIGENGTPSILPTSWPHLLKDSDTDPVCNPLLRLVKFIPLSTRKLRKVLQTLGEALRRRSRDRADRFLQDARSLARSLREELTQSVENNQQPPWVDALRAELDGVLSSLDFAGDLDPRKIEAIQMKLGVLERRFSGLLSDLEVNLAQLWADRMVWLYRDPEAVLESLVFSKYLIASPGMVDCIRSAMNIRHTLEKRYVKTALIVGGAGSGKDSMARLVRIFSPGYRFGRRAVLNMAMFRPKEVAVPFLLGLDVQYNARTIGEVSAMGLAGIFQQALSTSLEPRRSDPESEKDQYQVVEQNDRDTSRGFTFIFDELNSLDIDSQGALLRLLENAELQALGSIEPRSLNCLVVGVMNEDPELIMKKRTLDSLLRDESLFGGILGETLYELLRRQRRLRDDLYYRLARGGEIRIPELKDRREDLPVLTFFILREYIKSTPEVAEPDQWDVELSAYEVLMRPSVAWEGNIRELQAVCRRMLDLALEDHKLIGSPKLEILAKHAEAALKGLSAESAYKPKSKGEARDGK